MNPYQVIQRFQDDLLHANVFNPMRLESKMKQFNIEHINFMKIAYYCKSKLDAYYDLMQNVIVKFLSFAEFRQNAGAATVNKLMKGFDFKSLVTFYNELRLQYLQAYSNYLQVLPNAQRIIK